MLARPAALAAFVLAARVAAAEPGSHGKDSYTLFNPAPREQMRELTPDRPDLTESPFTVDAGHFQVELDFVSLLADHDTERGADVRTRGWSFASVNLKVGLLNQVDLQFVFDPYVRVRVDDRVARRRLTSSGTGDLATRLKINLWGNDGGRTAGGLLPYVKWPLPASGVRNGRTEGGLIVPFAAKLAEGWDLGAMSEVDFVADDNGGRETQWLHSITVGHEFTKTVGGYLEFAALTSRAAGFKWQGQVDVGLTFALSENTQFDAGCNFGVTRSAPDYQPFVGLTRRF